MIGILGYGRTRLGILTISCVLAPAVAFAFDVTTPEARKQTLLEYVASRSDLTAADKAAWDKALRLTFGGKAIQDGTDEGVTVAKSVVSAAIFYGLPPDKAAKAAYEAYHDTYRWVPPPLAVEYQILAFEGKKPAASARELAYRFPRYFNEELAPDLASWWDEMLRAGKVSPLEQDELRRVLRETRDLMRPMFKNKLWQAVELEARQGNGQAGLEARKALETLAQELERDFREVGRSAAANDTRASFYDRYRALAAELGEQPKPPLARPKAAEPNTPAPPAAPPPREQPREAPLPGDPLVAATPKLRSVLDSTVRAWLGTPYLFGGTDRRGVDCSGFVRAVFRESVRLELPRNSRAQWLLGVPVERPGLRPGDLLFFDTLDRGQVTHVGVYLGEGTFAHASSTKGVTRAVFGERYYQRAYWGSKRVFK